MKILYAALRHDPRNPDLASGVDYNFHAAFLRAGAQVQVVGPFHHSGSMAERVLKRIYTRITGEKYLKWNLQLTRSASSVLNRAEVACRPDLVFSLFPPPLASYRGNAPCVFNTDTTFQGWQDGGAGFGRTPLKFMAWQERRAVLKSSCVITFSTWCKNELMRRHGADEEKIVVHPMPSALPANVIPRNFDFVPKRLESPLRLLLVGRDYYRKGIPTAIEVVKQLNEQGIPSELTIVGIAGEADGPLRFAGLFRKSDPEELAKYADLYRQAHLLIHPAFFDPSPIVPAEAASFGVPTISNDVGGISTSVAHGISGIVLPRHSPAEAYVSTIVRWVRNPHEYAGLSVGARRRYEQEQNWEVAGSRVMKVLEQVVASYRQ